MPAGSIRPWLICYDIAEPRRLGRVHRFLSRHSVPVQYSVFLARLTADQLADVLAGINARIDPGRDDVRAYPLMARETAFALGKQILPQDLAVLDGTNDVMPGQTG